MLNRRVFDKIFTEFRGILEIERKFFVFVGILENNFSVNLSRIEHLYIAIHN